MPLPPRWLERLGLLAVLLGDASAQAATTVSGDVAATRFSNMGAAYAVNVNLQQAFASGGVLFGASNTEYAAGSLTVFGADAYRTQSSRFTWGIGASVGTAAVNSTSSTLYKARASLDAQLDSHWSIRVADQYLELDALRGNLASVSGEYRPVPRWGLKLGGGYAVNGTLADRYGELAVNWYSAQHVFGGVVYGRTGYDIANLGALSPVNRIFQLYVGASLPVRSGTLTLSFDTLSLDGGDRQTLRIGFIQALSP